MVGGRSWLGEGKSAIGILVMTASHLEQRQQIRSAMKALIIFPTICVFVMTLTLLKLEGTTKPRNALLRTIAVTAILSGLMIWFPVEGFFLYYGNWIGIMILIPCFTYLSNKLFKDNADKTRWIRILGLTIFSTILTVAIFALSLLFALTYNPTDPTPRQEQIQK